MTQEQANLAAVQELFAALRSGGDATATASFHGDDVNHDCFHPW